MINLQLFGNSLESKIRFLVLNIATGLLSLAVVASIFHFSLKYSYDTLLVGHTESLASLEEIRKKMIYLANCNQEHFSLDWQQEILLLWEDYQQIQEDLSREEKPMKLIFKISNILFDEESLQEEKQIFEENRSLLRKLGILINQARHMTDQNLQESFKDFTYDINETIFNIIKTDLKLVEIQKEHNSTIHSFLDYIVSAIMFFIVFVTLLLSFLIIKDIKNFHNVLENTIKEKTKALEEINENLHQIIKKEIAENQKKDQIMYQQARLASMGEMIGNIAHQWRQPLNALILLIQTFKVKSKNGKLTQDFIKMQVEEGLKIARIMSRTIEDFRNFFRPSSVEEAFNLKKNLQDSFALVDIFLKQEEIDFEIICPDNITLYGHSNAFSQVILNLIKNSMDIFKERKVNSPKIFIFVENYKGVNQEGYVKILFVDNGGGIWLNDIQKIFEPYFTTKHKSVGTGVGLYMSKQIIEKHMEGSIEVKNIKWNEQSKECSEDLTCSNDKERIGTQFILIIPLKNN